MNLSPRPQYLLKPMCAVRSVFSPAVRCGRMVAVHVVTMFLLVASAFGDTNPYQQGFRVIGQLEDQPGIAEEDRVESSDLLSVLKNRIDPSGQRGFRVRALGTDQVEFTFPNATREEIEQIWDRLTWTGNLVFRIVADKNRHPTLIEIARKTAGQLGSSVHSENANDTQQPKQIGAWVPLAQEQTPDGKNEDPVPFKFMPAESHLLRNGETGEIIDFDASRFYRGDWDQRRKEFRRWCLENNHDVVQILVSSPSDEMQNVEGKHITSITREFDATGNLRIEFALNSDGAQRMFSLTSNNRRANGRFAMLGILLDNQLISAPRINEPIRDRGVIEGNFTESETQGMIATLTSGKLHVPLQKDWISITDIGSDTDK